MFETQQKIEITAVPIIIGTLETINKWNYSIGISQKNEVKKKIFLGDLLSFDPKWERPDITGLKIR